MPIASQHQPVTLFHSSKKFKAEGEETKNPVSFHLYYMNMSSSVGADCTELKQRYDTCFNKWYSEKFLKGDTTPECEDLFKDYRACVMVIAKHEIVTE
jgi:hypothetical protein